MSLHMQVQAPYSVALGVPIPLWIYLWCPTDMLGGHLARREGVIQLGIHGKGIVQFVAAAVWAHVQHLIRRECNHIRTI